MLPFSGAMSVMGLLDLLFGINAVPTLSPATPAAKVLIASFLFIIILLAELGV
jgi:hypothetical protein